MPSNEELQRFYREASDAEIADAHELGQAGFSAEAWRIVDAEFTRRAAQPSVAAEVVEPDPPTPLSVAERTSLVREGHFYVRAVAGVAVGAHVLMLLTSSRAFEILQFADLALRVGLCVFLVMGKAWARWLLAAWIGIGATRLFWGLPGTWRISPTWAIGFAAMGLAWLGVFLMLALSPAITAYIENRRESAGAS